MLAKPFCMMFLSWVALVASEVKLAQKEYIDCEEEVDETNNRAEVMEMSMHTRPPCDVPICDPLPCNDGGPPPFCPRNVTICRSGCACITYCKDRKSTLYCYPVKFCRTPRRFSPDVFPTTRMMHHWNV
ncbi:hypothetical protein O0L34_g17371 [Tuta absoluta]|nr:hypothetical protein O0L34_g17371 [Tuta absoluta]